MKICSKCKINKLFQDFGKQKSHKDGLRSGCKDCTNKVSKNWRKTHKQKISIDHQRWYNQNKNKVSQYYKQWCQNNKERIFAYRHSSWGKAVIMRRNNKRRVICQNTDITIKWLIKLFENAIFCPLCDLKMVENGNLFNGKTLDHMVPINVGGLHMMNNVRVTCRRCNCKRPKDGSDYINTIGLLAKNPRPCLPTQTL